MSGPAPVGRRGAVGLIVPAGGSGTRLGSIRKQFRELGGEPLLIRTLRRFDLHHEIDRIYVAAPADRVQDLIEELAGSGLTKIEAIVAGGASRQQSVQAALDSVAPDVAFVLVHDAVRPFVSASEISAVVASVRQYGAAATAIPVADTLRRVGGGRFGETVSREGLFRMQTPQGFRIDWLREAFAVAEREGLDLTDDVALVQHLGHAVHVVEGNPRNFKITTPSDWSLAAELAAGEDNACA